MTEEKLDFLIKQCFGEHIDFKETIISESFRPFLVAITAIISSNNKRDGLIFSAIGEKIYRRKCFFDFYYRFNDTLDNLKKATIEIFEAFEVIEKPETK